MTTKVTQIAHINKLVTEFNQGVVTGRNIEAHIPTSGHGDIDSGGDSFFDRLLVLTSENPTDSIRTIFGLVNLAKKMMYTTKDLSKSDRFVQTLTQAILLSFQNKASLEQMKKYTRYFSNIDQETKSEIKEKIKKMAFELPLLTYFNAKETAEFNENELKSSKVLDETKNSSLLIMQQSQKLFQTDLSEVDLYVGETPKFPALFIILVELVLNN